MYQCQCQCVCVCVLNNMVFSTALVSNKNITANSPPATENTSSMTSPTTTSTIKTDITTSSTTTTPVVNAVTTSTPSIFISHKNSSNDNNNNNNNTNKHYNNTNIALSVSPTSTLPINSDNSNNHNNNSNSQNSDNNHSMGNAMDLNKIRKDSIAHSQGVGGVSWGSLTIGSWLRDEVMLRGFNNNNSNGNSNSNSASNSYNNIMGTMIENHIGSNSNYTSHSKMYNANRNSISYRRLSTINKLNNPNKTIKVEYDDSNNITNTNSKDIDHGHGHDTNKNNNHANDSYSNFSLNTSDNSDVLHLNSPLSTTSTYLPYFETQFCRDYSCCGLSLPGLHDLLRHFEEAHIGGIGYNSGFNSGNHINYNYSNYGMKKPNNYLKQQYTIKQYRNGLQEQLKSKNSNENTSLSNSIHNNNNTTKNENIQTGSISTPKNKDNLSNFTFNNDKDRDVTVRKGAKITTNKDTNINNRNNGTSSNSSTTTTGGSDDNSRVHNNKNNNSLIETSMDIALMNNGLLDMEFVPSNNHSINRISNSTSHDSTNNMGSDQNLRSNMVPSSIITQDSLNIGSDSNHLDLSHGLSVIDADPHYSNEIAVEDDDGDNDIDMNSDIKDVGSSNNNNNNSNSNNDNGNMAMNKNNNSFHNLKESVNSLDVTTNGGHNFHNILIENSDNLNNLLMGSFSIPQIHLNDNMRTHNRGNNNNSNSHDVLGGIGNSRSFMDDTIHNDASGMAHQDPLSNLHSNNDDDMNNDGNRVNFIDDPARRLYVMDHEEHKPFKCPVIGCEKTYKNQNGLKYHRLHGHQNQKLLENPDGTFTVLDPDSNEPYPEGMGCEKDKPYRCEVCGKRYKNLNGLKYHRGHSTH